MVDETKKKVEIGEVITVKEFADKAGIPVTSIISELMKNGVLATLNETIDYETASIIGDYLNIQVQPEIQKKAASSNQTKIVSASKNLVPRPPVVTIMGHVDHGKTSLLDKIREEHVALGESGGITQGISAYQITLEATKNKELKNKTITLIDTPGHAAFSAMREHGAAITDIVVLIVAANDGVMPQTIEALEQAKAANVPVIVALNKVDLPDADIMKTKQQLSEHGLISEDWGGKTIMIPISAKTGAGIEDLLEMILLQAELMELKADPSEMAIGIVIESYMQKGTGPLAIVLVENGTLHRGDAVAIGSSYGKVRILEDFKKSKIEAAGPSTPVRVAGLKTLPDFGDRLLAFGNEKEARETALKSESVKSTIKIATAKRISSVQTEENEKPVEQIELKLIIKSDVRGSLDAIKQSLTQINGDDYSIKIISEGVGPISDSDVTLARATGATIFGFRVNIFGAAKRMADKEGITVKTFQVIYELIDSAKEELANLLPPEIIEEELGSGQVLAIFRDDKKGFVAGGKVESGKISVGDEIKFMQNDKEKYRDKIQSLRKEKSESKEVVSGSEGGFGLSLHANVSVGDKFITFRTTKKKRKIT